MMMGKKFTKTRRRTQQHGHSILPPSASSIKGNNNNNDNDKEVENNRPSNAVDVPVSTQSSMPIKAATTTTTTNRKPKMSRYKRQEVEEEEQDEGEVGVDKGKEKEVFVVREATVVELDPAKAASMSIQTHVPPPLMREEEGTSRQQDPIHQSDNNDESDMEERSQSESSSSSNEKGTHSHSSSQSEKDHDTDDNDNNNDNGNDGADDGKNDNGAAEGNQSQPIVLDKNKSSPAKENSHDSKKVHVATKVFTNNNDAKVDDDDKDNNGKNNVLTNEHDPIAVSVKQDDDENAVVTNQSFTSLGICTSLQEACHRVQWHYATRIQAAVLPEAVAGRDVIGLAETGSGKTAAFVLPILQGLLQHPPRRGCAAALILTPTRELAFQIYQVVQSLGQAMGATAVCIVGGVDRTSQAIALAQHPHFILATPGRLVDHLQDTKGFQLRQLRYLVLDEADRMLSLDFEQELMQILDQIPTDRQTMLFSATMTSQVQKLQRASLRDPVKVQVDAKFKTPMNLLQYYAFLPAKYKDCYLTYLINEHAGQSILVFGATCNNVQRLALMLRNLGFPAVALHGQMNQAARLGALGKFAAGQRNILICTDVASRGLDLPAVDLVLNYDLPGHGKEYIHRVGRTARAGKSGKAIAIVTQYDVEVYQRLEALLGKKLPEYVMDEETVLVLLERVSDAQRLATRELKEQLAARGNRGSGGRRRPRGSTAGGDDDNGGGGADDALEHVLQKELKKGYYAGGSGGRGGALPNQRGGNKKHGGDGGRHRKKQRR